MKTAEISDIAYALAAIFTSDCNNNLSLKHHNEIQHVFLKVSEMLSEEDLKTLLYVNPELVNQAIEEKHLVDNIFKKKL